MELRNKYFLLLYIVLFSPAAFGQIEKLKERTDSINAAVNQSIQNSINKKPPLVNFSFYINGKKRRKVFKVFLVINNSKDSLVNRFGNLLDTSKFYSGDSIRYSLRFKKYMIESPIVDYRRLKHGGEIVFGIIKKFDKEWQKFSRNPDEYDIPNPSNRIQTHMHILAKQKINPPKLIGYSFVISNISEKYVMKWGDASD